MCVGAQSSREGRGGVENHQESDERPPLYFCAPFCTKECCTMLRIVPVKAFKDNYVWTLRTATHAAVAHPGEPRPVLDYLSRERLELAAILATHHHPDHVGGIAELLAMRPVPVYGPRKEPIPTLTRPVSEGDSVRIPELGVDFSVLDIPGHTRAHIAYYGAGSLFCGDTLFACGCGRLFEGTAEQMYASLQKLRALPDETKVIAGTSTRSRTSASPRPSSRATLRSSSARRASRQPGRRRPPRRRPHRRRPPGRSPRCRRPLFPTRPSCRPSRASSGSCRSRCAA